MGAATQPRGDDRLTEQLTTLAVRYLGDDCPSDELDRLVQLCSSELQARIGETLSAGLTADQIREFGRLAEADDEAAGLAFLNRNLPRFYEVVAVHQRRLLRDVRRRFVLMAAARIHAPREAAAEDAPADRLSAAPVLDTVRVDGETAT